MTIVTVGSQSTRKNCIILFFWFVIYFLLHGCFRHLTFYRTVVIQPYFSLCSTESRIASAIPSRNFDFIRFFQYFVFLWLKINISCLWRNRQIFLVWRRRNKNEGLMNVNLKDETYKTLFVYIGIVILHNCIPNWSLINILSSLEVTCLGLHEFVSSP